MSRASFNWRLTARLLTTLIGAIAVVAIATGEESIARWPLGILFGLTFSMNLLASKRGQTLSDLYPERKNRALVLSAEFAALLCGMTVLIS